MIDLDNAAFGYHRRPVIRCGRLHIAPGRCVGIYGANGSGKSTLVRGIAGVLAPLAGTVTRTATPAGRPPVAALVPQRQAIDPAWPMTAGDAAAMAASARSRTGWLGPRRHAVAAAMARLAVADLARGPFAHLSGGQQQRVLLAGALACRPDLLLLDEPAEGLDAASTASLLDLLRTHVDQGMAVVMISHEAGELARLADLFAWVEVAPTPATPNDLVVLDRAAFLDRATGAPAHPAATRSHA
jgi:zinc transport system ATP-binding protein